MTSLIEDFSWPVPAIFDLEVLAPSMSKWRLAFNVIVDHGCKMCSFFGKEYMLQLAQDESVTILAPSANMLDIVVLIGLFESKGRARKSWSGDLAIPVGFKSWKIGKKNPKLVFIWNPVQCLCFSGFDG